MGDTNARPSRTIVRFGNVVRQVKDATKDPQSLGISRVVGLDHLDPESLELRRWDELGELPDGTSFTRVFRRGQVLFGKRRAYQRKVAVAGFDGICSGDILVFEPTSDELLSEFLPYVVQSDGFFDHALGTSAGSLSPRTKWQELAKYEVALPPVSEQKRIAKEMRDFDELAEKLALVVANAAVLRLSIAGEVFDLPDDIPRVHLTELVRRPIQYGVLKPGPEYRGGVRCIDVKDYPEGRLLVDTVRRIDPAIDAQFERSRMATGDILVSIRGTIGRVTTVPAELDGANISRDSARVSLVDSVEPSYVRIVLESRPAQAELRGRVVGLAVKGINIADLRRVTIPLPPLEDQRELASRSERAREVGERADQSLASLRVLRRAFLAHALKGASLVQ